MGDFIKNFGLIRLSVILSVLLGIGVGTVQLFNYMRQPPMTLLYAGLDLKDSSRIVAKIESMNIPVQARADGSQIFVPNDQVARLRMMMAEDGLPSGGIVGYEIFDKQDGLSVTNFTHNLNRVRAMEGELARTITSLSGVGGARVHLVLPKRELFSREDTEPRASIMLRIEGPGKLAMNKVLAIQHLVAAAVPGLKVDNIAIVDDRGNLLAKGDHEGDMAQSTNVLENKIEYENRVTRALENIVGRVVGFDKVRVEVNAEVDRNIVTEKSEIFDPNGQVARSTQTSEQGEQSNSEKTSAITVENELPSAQQGQTITGGSGSNSKRNEETVNYEISKTIRTKTQAPGGINKISVAVVVDGYYKGGDTNNKGTYQERTPDELKKIEDLVKSAIGFDEKRGDTVKIMNLKFADQSPVFGATNTDNLMFGFEKRDILHVVEVLILGLLGMVALLTFVRPFVNKLLQANLMAPRKNLASSDEDDAEIDDGAEGHIQEMIQNRRTKGKIRASAMRSVNNVIQDNTTEAVSVVRSWLQQK